MDHRLLHSLGSSHSSSSMAYVRNQLHRRQSISVQHQIEEILGNIPSHWLSLGLCKYSVDDRNANLIYIMSMVLPKLEVPTYNKASVRAKFEGYACRLYCFKNCTVALFRLFLDPEIPIGPIKSPLVSWVYQHCSSYLLILEILPACCSHIWVCRIIQCQYSRLEKHIFPR